MLAKVLSGVSLGLESVLVTVEVDIATQGLPSFTIVGLADRAVEEAKERVRASIKNSGADFPSKRITVNLAPADLPKEGPSLDLPLALGILTASGQIDKDLMDTMVTGELSLDGSLSSTKGILPLTILAKQLKLCRIFVPLENASEASVVEGIEVYGFKNLKQVVEFLNGVVEMTPQPVLDLKAEEDSSFEYDFSEIKGQNQAKRALEIAAAGGHNVLLSGPPGSGKTLLARAFISILPPLSKSEALEVTKLYSISGSLTRETPIIFKRPFRSPHHTASYVGIIGGGNNIKPGEISMAHRGVLFLDELPEFQRSVLEALRQPLEDHQITISRSSGSLTFPAQFMLLAACNSCPCGFLGSKKTCICLPGQISRYRKKISGPILDRIDINLDVPAVEVDKLTSDVSSEKSAEIRSRVSKAREIQLKRFKDLGIITNSEMKAKDVKQFCKLDTDSLNLLKVALTQMNLSARAYHRVLKLARTIADLEGAEEINLEHIAESLTYKGETTDKNYA